MAKSDDWKERDRAAKNNERIARALGWKPQPWYTGRGTQHIATYNDQRQLQYEVGIARTFGWEVSSATGTSGHINLSRTAAKVIFTGGVGLFLGASRTKDTITLVFTRHALPNPPKSPKATRKRSTAKKRGASTKPSVERAAPTKRSGTRKG